MENGWAEKRASTKAVLLVDEMVAEMVGLMDDE